MRKSQFIKTYADAAGKLRKKNFPNMRISEEIASAVCDEETAEKLWRKYRKEYATKTVEEFKAALQGAGETK